MFAIIGLGNPGKKYERTRHNIGYLVIDELARKNNIKINKVKYESIIGIGDIEGKEVILVKPLTFMNESGKAVNLIKRKFNIDNKDIIVISDSLDLPAGKIRIKLGGSSGGHNGLESIIQYIGKDFIRFRIGIGRPDKKGDEINYVLDRINKQEQSFIKDGIEKSAEAIIWLISDGLESVMNEFN